MAINSGILNGIIVNAFGPRRTLVLNNLLQQRYSAAKVVGGHGRGKPPISMRPDFYRTFEDAPAILNFEQPFVTVEVTMDGNRMTQTQEQTRRSEFVSITNLVVKHLAS